MAGAAAGWRPCVVAAVETCFGPGPGGQLGVSGSEAHLVVAGAPRLVPVELWR